MNNKSNKENHFNLVENQEISDEFANDTETSKERKKRKVYRVNLFKAQKIVDELEEKIRKGEPPFSEDLTISQSEFIRRNLTKFQALGLSKRSIYNFLVNNGVVLGSFDSFMSAWAHHAKKACEVASGEINGET